MVRLFIFGSVFDIAFTLAECVFHFQWLPLGGTHAAQLGVCLGVPLMLVTLIDAFRPPPPPPSP